MARGRFAVVAGLAGAFACSDGSKPVDTPGDPGHVRFELACAPASSVAFAATELGQTSTQIVHVINDGDIDVTLGSLEEVHHVDGADASEFEVFSTNVGVLAPGAWCQQTILFRPTSTGTKQATYEFGRGAGSIALTGTAAAASASFHADVANGSFGYARDWRVDGLLRNDSAATVDIGTLSVPPPFMQSSQCPANLAPGGACSFSVSIDRNAAGTECQTADLTTTGSSLRIPFSWTPGLPLTANFTAVVYGSGAGTVTAQNGEINCNNTGTAGCQAIFWRPPASLTLTAEAAEDSELIGWTQSGSLLPCGNAAECTFQIEQPLPQKTTEQSVQVWFARKTDKHIRVNIVGTGWVAAVGLLGFDSSFTFAVPGGPIQLEATTSGTFVGWSGDCTGTGDCQLGTVINDREVTATFSP